MTQAREVKPLRRAWSRLAQVDARRHNRLVRRLPLAWGARVPALFRQLFGAEASIRPLAVGFAPWEEAMGLAPLVEACWQPPHYVGRAWVGVQMEPRLALCLIDRLLGGSAGDALARPAASLSPLECGGLAYALARLVSEASAWPWQLCGVTELPRWPNDASGDAQAMVWSVQLRVGKDTGLVRLVVPEAMLPHLRLEPPTLEALQRCASLMTTVTLEAGRAWLPAAELAGLQPGDHLVPDELWWAPPSLAAPTKRQLRLRPLQGRRASWWCLWTDALRLHQLQVHGGHALETVTSMDNRDEDRRVDWSVAMGVVGDAPVELTLELARWSLPLEELASLRPGQIVHAGVPVDAPVALRAGGKVVATGELVDVDGEVALRITALGA